MVGDGGESGLEENWKRHDHLGNNYVSINIYRCLTSEMYRSIRSKVRHPRSASSKKKKKKKKKSETRTASVLKAITSTICRLCFCPNK